MKKMIETIKKAFANIMRTRQEAAPFLHSLLYDNRAMQVIAI